MQDLSQIEANFFQQEIYNFLQIKNSFQKFLFFSAGGSPCKFERVTVHSFNFEFKFGIVILSRLKLSEIEPPQRIYAGRRICTGSR